MATPPDQLKQAAEMAKEKGKVAITVRQLLKWYGYSRRGSWIVGNIRDHLTGLGVQTVPDFDSVWMDGTVYIMPAEPSEPAKAPAPTAETTADSEDDTPVEVAVTPAHRISRLEASDTEVVSVKPEESLVKATTLMLINDFSQLPVMKNERSVVGVISWRSIGQKAALGKGCIADRLSGSRHWIGVELDELPDDGLDGFDTPSPMTPSGSNIAVQSQPLVKSVKSVKGCVGSSAGNSTDLHSGADAGEVA